jgi:hypothetical protein
MNDFRTAACALFKEATSYAKRLHRILSLRAISGPLSGVFS